MLGECVFATPTTETAVDSLGCRNFTGTVPAGYTGISTWYIGSGPFSTNDQWLLYKTNGGVFQLQHNALWAQTWGQWSAPFNPGDSYEFTARFGNGNGAQLQCSFFSGTYDANQDPANPNAGSITRCAYGTQSQPSASVTAVVTPALVDVVLTALDLEELAFLFDVIWYSTLNISEMCSSLPPAAPPIDLSLLTASPATLQQLFTALAWPHFCQCTPGSPNPVPPISPQGPTTTPWPTQPTFPCADTDVCAALVAMQRQLQALQATLASVWDVTSSVQRFAVPFGYIGSVQHTGLTGSGSLTISRLVGLQVVVTGLPEGNKVLESNPPYLWDVGWISVSDGGGMLQQRRVARQSMTWMPPGMQDATVVGYFAEPGVTLSIVELEPEP